MEDDKVVLMTPRRADNDRIPVNLPDIAMAGGFAGMDVEAFYNIRSLIQEACIARGFKITGAGMGCGACDLDIEIEGFHYNLTIKPLP